MIDEIFTCDGLNKHDCSMRDYCAWCLQPNNITNVSFCKQVDSCASNSSDACDFRNNPGKCFVDELFLCLMLFILYTLCIIIITDIIKNILRKILIKPKGTDVVNDDFVEKIVYLKEITSLNNNENTHLIKSVEQETIKLLNEKIDKIGYIIGLIIYVVVGTASLILYFTNFFMFLVEMLFFVIFIILLFCSMTWFF